MNRKVFYLLAPARFCGNQLKLYVVVETEADPDLLLHAEGLQAEEAAPAALRALQEVDVERLG